MNCRETQQYWRHESTNKKESLNKTEQKPSLTLVRQQSLVQEFSGGPKVRRDVGVGEVVHLDAHVLDVHAGIERLAGVDPCAVGGVEDVGDAHSLQTSFVDRNGSAKEKES